MKKVLLIYGGKSSEHKVSCNSAKSIIQNIDKNKYDLECIKITKDGIWMHNDEEIDNIIEFIKNFDVVFPIIHGTNGEDGKLQGLLDLFNINYVGAKCGPSYICMDKERTKQTLNAYNIPQVPYEIYEKGKKINLDFPVIIKPANGGSSVGIDIANNNRQLKNAIKNALKYDKKIIIEKYLQVQELECAVLEDNNLIVSEVGEILPANEFYDYEDKYENKLSKTLIPANISKEVSEKIKEYSKLIFKILELNGLSRIDFFYDKINNKIYLNEINTIPGFTEISMYPKLIMNEGYTYQQLITILIENAQKYPKCQDTLFFLS